MALAMRNLGAGVGGWMVNTKARQLYAQESDPVNIVDEVQWVPGPVWTGPENLTPHWVSNPKLSKPHTASLYRLRYLVNTSRSPG
jgi:hypothetical protein